LEEGGPKRLELSWRGHYEHFQVRVDGGLVGESGKSALVRGESWRLPDGSELAVKLHQQGFVLLLVERDGRPLPGSGGHPTTAARSAAYWLLFLCWVFVLWDVFILRTRTELSGVTGPQVLSVAASVAIGLSGLVALRRPWVGLTAGILFTALRTLEASSRWQPYGMPRALVLLLLLLFPVLSALYVLKRAPTASGATHLAS
jgi:hypothetical protein